MIGEVIGTAIGADVAISVSAGGLAAGTRPPLTRSKQSRNHVPPKSRSTGMAGGSSGESSTLRLFP